jgi:hypothetical protein
LSQKIIQELLHVGETSDRFDGLHDVQAVFFGVGMVAILRTSEQSDAMTTIPATIAFSFLASAVIAWVIAPRVRQRYWRAKGSDGDLISG